MSISFKTSEDQVEALVLRTFLKAVEILGGLQKLVKKKNTDWLSPLLLACYTVVLKEEYLKTEQEIAQYLGITHQTVKNILRAEHLKAWQDEEGKDLSVHMAGSIAKTAYRLIKEDLDNVSLVLEFFKNFAKALDITWAHLILRKLRGNDFPIESPEDIKEKLGKVYIKGRLAQEILEEIEYPINTPMELVEKIKENLKMYGLE